MPTITKRNDTYKITVSAGYDINGKQIRRYMTWKPPSGMTAKQIEKEAQRQAILFEEKVRSGTYLKRANQEAQTIQSRLFSKTRFRS